MTSFYSPIRTVWLIGDSFQRGFAAGYFSDEISAAHPVFGLASPANVMNLVLKENNLPLRAIGGPDGLGVAGFTEAGLATDLADFIDDRPVLDGDFMLLEDAGSHNSNPTTYQAAFESVIDVAQGRGLAEIFCMTVFDYPLVHGFGSAFEWDTEFSGTTMNEAIQAAATAQGITCIDMNAIMDSYKAASLAADNVNAMQLYNGNDDGIHPGIWGNLRMTGEYMSAMGLTEHLATINSLRAIVSDNWADLASGSGSWTEAKALNYLEEAIYV